MLTLRRFQRELIAGAVLALALPVRAAEVDKYLPEDTEAVLVVNARQLLDSPLVTKHLLEHVRGALKSNDEATKILESLGFDPLKDLTSFTAAVPMLGSDAKVLIIMHGRFDKAKFETKADDVVKEKGEVLKIHKDGNRKVYEVKMEGGEKPGFVGIVDQSTIVASPEKQFVLDAFAKADGTKKTAVKKELQDLIEKADAKQSLWFAATANAFLKGDLSGDEKAKKTLEKTHNITGGITVDRGVTAALVIAAKSPDNAKEISEDIKVGLEQAKGLLTLLAEQNKQLAPLVDTIGGLRVNTEGNNITLKTEVSEQVIEKSMKKN